MDDSRQSVLPPLPPSDAKSLEWNRYDYFYQTKSRDFWSQAEVVREEIKPFEKCQHFFVKIPQGAKCKKCHVGFAGSFEISNGQIFFQGKPIGI